MGEARILGVWKENTRLEQELTITRMEKERLLGQLEESQRRVERLTEIIAELKREGFQPPAESPVLPEVAENLDAAVRMAIGKVAKPGTLLYRQEAEHAQALLKAGRNPDEVADEIRRGGQFEPWA